jgi:hypothetical protein
MAVTEKNLPIDACCFKCHKGCRKLWCQIQCDNCKPIGLSLDRIRKSLTESAADTSTMETNKR